MNFYKITIFIAVCLGIATTANSMESFRKKSGVNAKTLIADLLKQKERQLLSQRIAEMRARVVPLKTLKQPLKVKKFLFSEVFPKDKTPEQSKFYKIKSGDGAMSGCNSQDSHKKQMLPQEESKSSQYPELPELKSFDFEKPWWKKRCSIL